MNPVIGRRDAYDRDLAQTPIDALGTFQHLRRQAAVHRHALNPSNSKVTGLGSSSTRLPGRITRLKHHADGVAKLREAQFLDQRFRESADRGQPTVDPFDCFKLHRTE
jgi:hypothetical protein